MKILVVGSGGREHALLWKIAQSPLVAALACTPGNAGAARLAECFDIAADDVEGVVRLAKTGGFDLVVIGPEAPLAAGLADRLNEAGIAAFGPSAAAAQLEASKAFTKTICDAVGAPTAAWARFTTPEAARHHITDIGLPLVLKVDGLAGGKGVVIPETLDIALAVVGEMFGGAFGAAGAELVIEEFLEGEEASVFAFCDGETAIPLAAAQDHKRAFDGDTGSNTGGMGAYSPAAVATDAVIAFTMDRIIRPVLAEMARRGTPYRGVLYAGLMIGAEGPKLIEFNVRFGDPECQILMMRMASDIVPYLRACATGGLGQLPPIEWRDDPAVTVVMAAKGYPGAYETGTPIRNLDAAGTIEGVEIFHAGTRLGPKGEILAAGGRVLNVTATAGTLRDAIDRAYTAVDLIDWPHGFCRRDIGWRALERRR